MKILERLDHNKIMPLNFIYHKGTKDTEYKDYMDIIYKELDTGEKKVETIEEPLMEIYFEKESDRSANYNKNFLELEDAEKHVVKYRNLENYIAQQAGPDKVNWVKELRKNGNYGYVKNIHKYPYVFGSDYDIENWYRAQWVINNHNDRDKKVTKQFLDIEVDSIDTPGFPQPGECPINAVTIVDEESNTSYTFVLRNEKNPQIQEFEDTIDSFIEELHEAFDETYGDIEYKFYMYDEDNELELIKDMFRLINTLKRDFLMIWNMDFDINFVIARIKELGGDPYDIMCHKDFPVKTLFYKKDKRNYQVQNKSDYFNISSYTVYLDQMLIYAGLRKGQGEARSYALNAVARKEVGDEKLDYSEDANIKTLPYVDFKKFIMYNIKDVLLQLGIERKTNDVDNIYQRAYSNATSYSKIFKQTV